MVQNVSECLSGWYFLNHKPYCYQIWCGDAASWASLSCGFVLFLLSSRSRSQRGLMYSKYDSFYLLYFLNCWFLGNQTCSDIHHHKPEYPVKKKRITAFRVRVTAKGQNVNVCPDDAFDTTKYFVSKLISSVPLISWQPKKVCWFAIHNNQTKYNKVGIICQ